MSEHPQTPRLLIYTSADAVLPVELECETIVGRSARADVRLADESVSRRHALLQPQPDGTWLLQDLGSANGTWCGEEAVRLPVGLCDRDHIRFGDVDAEYRGPSALRPRSAEYSGQTRATLQGHRRTGHSVAIVGTSPRMVEVYALARLAAGSSIPVLLTGETGTGKELLAHAIHDEGPRSAGAFVPINCAAIPEALVESELFGHRKGSFTGAAANHTGLLESAKGGTVFLDEVGELPTNIQAKLLRFLQEGEVLRIGDSRPTCIDVRVVSASNRDLTKDGGVDGFRRDLYYRLATFTISLPPLRSRCEDIRLLAMYFLARACDRHGKQIDGFDPRTLELFEAYGWPGNVRELENEVLRCSLVTAAGRPVLPRDVAPRIRDRAGTGITPGPSPVERDGAEADPPGDAAPDLRHAMAHFERSHIADVLEACGGNVTHAARALGVSRGSLHKKLKEYSLR